MDTTRTTSAQSERDFPSSSMKGDIVPQRVCPFPLALSCTGPGFGDVTNGNG